MRLAVASILLAACAAPVGTLSQAVSCPPAALVQVTPPSPVSGSSRVATFASPTTAGNVIVVLARKFGSGAFVVPTDGGDVFAQVIAKVGATELRGYVATARGGSTTVNMATGPDTAIEMQAFEVSGVGPVLTASADGAHGGAVTLAGGVVLGAGSASGWGNGFSVPVPGWTWRGTWFNPSTGTVSRVVGAGTWDPAWVLPGYAYAEIGITVGLEAACGAPQADLGVAADIAAPADLAVRVDLARSADLAVPVDLARAPDLSRLPDLAQSGDLTVTLACYDDTLRLGPGLSHVLSADLVASGSQALTIGDESGAPCMVDCAGHSIRATTTGDVTIKNCYLINCGTDPGYPGGDNEQSSGIALRLSGNARATLAGVYLSRSSETRIQCDGNSGVDVLRLSVAEDGIVYIEQEVGAGSHHQPALHILGSSAAPKSVKSSNFYRGALWPWADNTTVGGLGRGDGNLFVGHRSEVVYNGSGFKFQGNYSRVKYPFTSPDVVSVAPVAYGRSTDGLGEHNVIVGAEWGLRIVEGEWRYNAFLQFGHSAAQAFGVNARFHHNVVADYTFQDRNRDPGGAVAHVYPLNVGNRVDHNTIDGGLRTNIAFAPAASGAFDNFDHNALLRWRIDAPLYAAPLPLACSSNVYDDSVAASYACAAPGALRFAGPLPVAFPFCDASIEARAPGFTVADILAYYRARYTPGQGSAAHLGGGQYIGAVGTGVEQDDLFGRVLVP